jgi:hypothetical protein
MVTAFLWIATLQLSLMLVLLPGGSVAQLPPGLVAGLNTTDEFYSTLLATCQTDIIDIYACIAKTGALNETDPASSNFLAECVDCFNKTFTADGATPLAQQVDCTEVDERIDIGLDACSTVCEVQGCIPTVEKAFQCIFQNAVNCTTGEILRPPPSSPVASPTTTTGGGSNSSSGNGPVSSGVAPPTPAASGGGGVAPPTPAASSGDTPAASSGATMSGVRFGVATLLAAATTTLAFVGLINY